METSIFITVALCTHNHADRLPRTLEDLGLDDVADELAGMGKIAS